MNKFAMITRCDSKAKELAEVTHDILKGYAESWGCDFVVLGDEIEDTGDYEKNHYRILEVQKYLDQYERVLIIDSDVIIMPGTPNPFEIVPETNIGSIYEDVGSRKAYRHMVIRDIQEQFGEIKWREGYINTGFFICSNIHKDIFNKIDGELWYGFGYDDALIGYNINKYGYKVYELDYKWNHTQMFSEPWNNNANRFDSYIIHYAGAARFPDDLSGRKSFTNSLADRIELIKSDMDRITEGLMTFTDAMPTEKQGYGSVVYKCNYGVQKMPIVIKVSNTEECFHREVENLQKDIPNAVKMLGSGSDPSVGNFIMLEELKPLPDIIDEPTMDDIVWSMLETIRWCYLNDVTWIPKLDHIMLNNDGEVRLVDFGDDHYGPVRFFGDSGRHIEGMLMDGSCDNDGNYIMRYTYPLSGFRAIISYLLKKNNIDRDIRMYELDMVIAEYQRLKDVHEPINYPYLSNIFRTESEPGDAKCGQLVPPNRTCRDRAEMLSKHLPIKRGRSDIITWLDIGCNVGWFQFEFAKLGFNMIGVERDTEKVNFNIMISDLHEHRVDLPDTFIYPIFKSGEVDIDYISQQPMYDIISAFSILHLKLVQDKDRVAFWNLLEAICSKVKSLFFLEFPPHSYALAGVSDTKQFIEEVKRIGKFDSVEQIGVTDAKRPMLKCTKGGNN